MFRRILVAVMLVGTVAASSRATAQVNIEQRRSQGEGTTFSIDASVSVRSGNSDLFDVAAGAQLSSRRTPNSILWLARAKYGENNGDSYSGSAFSHLRFTRSFSPIFAGEAFAQLEHDQFTLLQLRSLVGSGIRVRLADAPSAAAHVGSAIMIEFENLDAAKVIEHPARTEALRWSNYISIRWDIAERASFSTTAYAQPDLSDFADVRILHEAALDVAITEALSFRVVLRQRLDSRPPDDIERFDLFVENGLRLRF